MTVPLHKIQFCFMQSLWNIVTKQDAERTFLLLVLSLSRRGHTGRKLLASYQIVRIYKAGFEAGVMCCAERMVLEPELSDNQLGIQPLYGHLRIIIKSTGNNYGYLSNKIMPVYIRHSSLYM